MEHTLLFFISLTCVGLVAGIVDTLAGGGGLITLPALLATGLPAPIALGTNKLQGAMGELTASVKFFRKQHFNIRDILPGLIFASTGSILGAITVQLIHPTVLEKILPFMLLFILVYVIFSPKFLHPYAKPKLSPKAFYIICGLGIGFYNGFFGPATGSLWAFFFMFLLSYSMVKATVHAKPLNFAGNFISVIVFIIAGNVHYSYALVMCVGQLIGAQIGAHLVMYKGHKIIRPLFITVVSITILQLFLKHHPQDTVKLAGLFHQFV